jgi:high-affinity iron transporter
MRKTSAVIVLVSILIGVFPIPLFAAPRTWNEVVDSMELILDRSHDTYFAGDGEKAKAEVDEAYFGFYE